MAKLILHSVYYAYDPLGSVTFIDQSKKYEICEDYSITVSEWFHLGKPTEIERDYDEGTAFWRERDGWMESNPDRPVFNR